jgi:hypothetical protein
VSVAARGRTRSPPRRRIRRRGGVGGPFFCGASFTAADRSRGPPEPRAVRRAAAVPARRAGPARRVEVPEPREVVHSAMDTSIPA